MSPGPNPFKTQVIGAPADGSMPTCESIEATVAEDREGTRVFSTCWEPSEEEIAALQRGEKLWLHIYAHALPPASITVGERPFYLEG